MICTPVGSKSATLRVTIGMAWVIPVAAIRASRSLRGLGYAKRHNTAPRVRPRARHAAQMEAEGMGYLSPVVSNLTDKGRETNRRVEVVLLSTE